MSGTVASSGGTHEPFAARPGGLAGLKVAALIDTWDVSGPGRQLVALARALAAKGIAFRVYMFERAGRGRSPFVGYLEGAAVDHVVIPERGRLDIAALARLYGDLKAWRPDVVQTHSYKMTACAYAMRWLRPSWPWIAFFHGSTNEDWKVELYNRLDRALFPVADRLVVMSEAHRRSMASRRRDATVIYNACVSRPVAHAEEPARPARPRIGVIGRLSPEKGVDVFLSAVALLRRDGPPVSAVVAGAGPEHDKLRLQAERLGIGADVSFLGNVADVSDLYGRLDLVVLPSRSEGLPNVLLEAIQAGVPVVATTVGAIPEVVTDPACGELVPPDDPEALCRAMRSVLAREDGPAALAARRDVTRRFSLETRVQRHLQIYAEVLARRQAAFA